MKHTMRMISTLGLLIGFSLLPPSEASAQFAPCQTSCFASSRCDQPCSIDQVCTTCGIYGLCGRIPEPDDTRTFPGLKAGIATARLYQAGSYDRPVVIPTPFDPRERTGEQFTGEKLYLFFSPFIRAAQAQGYDIWIVQTRTGQNIHEQAAEFAQALNHAANRAPSGNAIVAAFSLGGVTARISTARWQAEPAQGGWSAAERAQLGLGARLPVSLIVFGDSPLEGAHASVGLQDGIRQLGVLNEFNLDTCGAQQLLRRNVLNLPSADLQENFRRFYETGQTIYFRGFGAYDRIGVAPDGSGIAGICDAGPAVFSINGDGWAHGVRIVAFANSSPGPIECYGGSRDLTLGGDDVCIGYPPPRPRTPQIGEQMWKLRRPFQPDRFVYAEAEDLEPGSRLGSLANEVRCDSIPIIRICGGFDQRFAGTFIPYASALPATGPFFRTRPRDFNAVHASVDAETIGWVVDQMEMVTSGQGLLLRLNESLFCPGTAWRVTVANGAASRPVRLVEEQFAGGRWIETVNRNIGITDSEGTYSETFTAPGIGQYRARVIVGSETSNDVEYEVRFCGGGTTAPSLLTASVSGYDVNLTWRDNSDDEVEFRIQRKDSPGGEWYRIGEVPTDNTRFTDSVREPPGVADEWFYRVRAWNGVTGSGFSNEIRVVVYRMAPTQAPVVNGPMGCIATRRPTFSWRSTPGAMGYRLVVAPAGTDDFFIDVYPTTLSYTPPFDLGYGQEYRWKVRATNNVGVGPWTDSIYFTPLCAPLTAPNLLTPMGCSSVRPTFTWTAVPGVTNYRIVVAPATTDDFFIDEYPVGTSFTPSFDLTLGQEYRFKVRGVNGGTPGPWSRHRFFAPGCVSGGLPGIASPLSPWFALVGTTTPTFEWEVASNAAEYLLEVRRMPGEILVHQVWYAASGICAGTQCSVRPATVLANGSHYWVVTARNGSGVGSGSPGIYFTVSVQPPVARPGGPYTGVMGSPISFNGSASSDPDGTIVNYQWNFGDGAVGSGPTPAHVYASYGNYTMTLTVTDNSGLTGSATTTVTVNSRPPVVTVSSSGSCGGFGCSVTFTATATDPDGDPLTYSWTGCGTGTLTSVTCMRGSSGNLSATVTVSDGRGGVTTVTGTRAVYASGHTTGAWSACTGTGAYTCTSAGPTGCSRPGTQSRSVTETSWTLDLGQAQPPPVSSQACTQTAQGYIATYNSSYDASWTCTAAGPNGCYKNRLSYSPATFRAMGPDEAVPPVRIYAYGYIAGYYVGEWSACDAGCGVQFRNRTVTANSWRAPAPDVEAPISNQRCDLPPCRLTCGDYSLYSTRRECEDAGWPVCEIRYRDDGVDGLLTCWAGFS